MVDWFPVWLSLRVAAVSVTATFILGTACALLMARRRFAGQAALEALFTMPLVLPPVVTGFLLLLLLGKHGPVGQLWLRLFHHPVIFTPYAAMLAGMVVSFPLMYQSAKAAFQSVDANLEDAARTLGSNETRVFLTITMPLAWPGLLAGLILSFARALGEFGATIMVAGNIPGLTQTMPLAIYFAAEANDLTTAGWYVLIISAITFSLVFWLNTHFSGRRQHKE